MSRVLARLPLVGREWTIREAAGETIEHEYHGGQPCKKGAKGCIDAFTCWNSRTIWLRNDLDDEAALRAVIHEWAHVEHPKERRHKRIYRIDEELGALLVAMGWAKRRRRSRRP